uniref:Precursor of CEP9-like n=1 Tax=Cicer arietinum TaxID=3827 RepID=A0A1S2YSH5_CICAR|nr:precursor of CEP9-like [Cicer arietinum]
MAKFQATIKHFALFLALIACNYSLQSHARLIKPLNQHNVPTSTSKKNNEVASYFVDSSSEVHTNAFQPTAPGNSPGVGHKYFTEQDINLKAKKIQSPNVEVSVTEDTKNDFKKTDPGHSPGVGHAYQNEIGN